MLILAAAAAASSSGSDLLIAIIVALVSPAVLAVIVSFTARRKDQRDAIQRHADKMEDWARQDTVAELAATAARDLAAAQNAAAGKAAEAARLLVERQDDAAAKAATAASDLASAQAETNARTDEVARLAAIDAARSSAKLDRMEALGQITHALVNSDMTEAREGELILARALVIVLQRVVAARVTGEAPDPADIAAIAQAKARIIELETIVADRKAVQQKLAAAP